MDALFDPLAALVAPALTRSSLFIRVPASQPSLRHLFSVTVAVLFFFPFEDIFRVLPTPCEYPATYFIAKYDKSSKMPWIVFVIVMGHLTVNHVIRAIYGTSYETMEVTGPQMVLTMKLTTFAWNVYDGRRKEEELDKWQLSKRVTKYPSILEFLGYSFYFPGILVGPYLDFAEYMDLVNETMFLASRRSVQAYTRMLLGLIYLGVFVVLGPTYNYACCFDTLVASKSLLNRIIYFQAFGPVERCKYYAIWTLTRVPVSSLVSGFTGFGPHGEAHWDGAANVKVLTIELPSNFKVLLDAWNMKTNVWLRECVYKRVTPKGKKPGNTSQMITFFTSAFWHGIAGGYYMTFLMGGFITAAARQARTLIRPFFAPAEGKPTTLTKRVYDLVTVVLSIMILNYAAAPFIIGGALDSVATWKLLGWYGHVIVFGGLLFFYLGGAKFLKGLQRQMGIVVPSRGPKPATGAPAKNGSAVSSGTATPINEKNFVLPPSVDKLVPPPQ
ncbi:endoplasmic reticulum protein [Ephemerocybe angulata]|uniref:Endoplasmic reticulum protein n=1 Tax=Ephemerocybe angulata TaxID=980116 RepID=A0A8H6ME10_9AGAR|nr:endoplasmic reticulum protein [Tulosesus angulatus]